MKSAGRIKQCSRTFLSVFLFLTVVIGLFGISAPLAKEQVLSSNAQTNENAVTKTKSEQPETPIVSETDKNKDTNYSDEAVLLVILVLALLIAIFFLLMYWSQRSDRLSYLGRLYQETIEDIEFKRFSAKYTEKMKTGEYHREVETDTEWIKQNPLPPRPDELPFRGPTGSFFGTRAPGFDPWGSDYSGYTIPESERELDPARKEQFKKIEEKWAKEMSNWEQRRELEVQRRYQHDLDSARSKAKDQAALAIDVDLSALRGRGAEFVLEFTTVVVIIFASVILGILKILDTQQIGTLLAAIAGYVLGRATQRARNEPSTTPKPEPKPVK